MSVNQQRINRITASEIGVDTPVYTRDGERIGAVCEMTDVHLKVNAPLQRDYWLSLDYVAAATPEGVHLSFDKSDLGAYKQEGGEPQLDEPSGQFAGGVILSEEEQREQRERMARELAEQRRELPHSHDSESGAPDTGGTIGEPVEVELERMETTGADTLDAQLGSFGDIEQPRFLRPDLGTAHGAAGERPVPRFGEYRSAQRMRDASRDPYRTFERALLFGQGAFFTASGIWPLVSMPTFERVTGEKTDDWLVKTVGVLVTVVGGTLMYSAARGKPSPETRMIAIGTSAALGGVSAWYSLRRRISKIYLGDTAAEASLVAAWGVLGLLRRTRPSNDDE